MLEFAIGVKLAQNPKLFSRPGELHRSQRILDSRRSQHVKKQISQRLVPPGLKLTDFLCSILSCDAVIGDLLERYGRLSQQRGYFRAATWFWKQLITSLPFFAWAWLKRASGLEAILRRIGR
jgi:hypothetical protein